MAGTILNALGNAGVSFKNVAQAPVSNGCPPGKVKMLGKCVSIQSATGNAAAGAVSVGSVALNPTLPPTGSGNNATQTQTAQTMPNIPLNSATIQHATGSGTVGTATAVSTVGVGANANKAADTPAADDNQSWYKKYLWLEVAAAILILALALWLIFRKKK